MNILLYRLRYADILFFRKKMASRKGLRGEWQLTSKNAVQIDNLVKRYKGKAVVDDLSLTVPAGQVFGLLGPNGAGKTTLLKMIAGLVTPDSGALRIYGRDGLARDLNVRRMIGLIPQDNNLERDVTVREALVVYAKLFGVKPLDEALEQTIEQFELGGMLNKTVRSLSGGMMRRVLIARSLMPQPRLLLLDEPTVGLDPDVRQDLWNIVDELTRSGKTVILTTHYMEEAVKLCSRIAMLKQGRVALLDTPEGLERRFGGSGTKVENLEALFIQLAKEKS